MDYPRHSSHRGDHLTLYTQYTFAATVRSESHLPHLLPAHQQRRKESTPTQLLTNVKPLGSREFFPIATPKFPRHRDLSFNTKREHVHPRSLSSSVNHFDTQLGATRPQRHFLPVPLKQNRHLVHHRSYQEKIGALRCLLEGALLKCTDDVVGRDVLQSQSA